MHRRLDQLLCQHVRNSTFPAVRGFVRLTKLPSFVDCDMFLRYCSGRVGHGNSAAVAEVTVDLTEVVDGSPGTCFKFEDTDEETVNMYQVYLT